MLDGLFTSTEHSKNIGYSIFQQFPWDQTLRNQNGVASLRRFSVKAPEVGLTDSDFQEGSTRRHPFMTNNYNILDTTTNTISKKIAETE
jgi:hypothetical protein